MHLQESLQKWGIESEVRHVRTLTSAVTTGWGVDWDETYIARDLMQNFFDANRACLDQVKVIQRGTDVLISAPNTFKLERLFYLGSEKGDDDIGQYGEGFKVAATCLLRDHNVSPIVISGRDLVCLRVAEESVADTLLYPVEYDFYNLAQDVAGTHLLLPGCPTKLARALSVGLSHFFYETNPLLGEKCWTSSDGLFSLYASREKNGHVFYHKLKRGEIEGLPIILVIDKQFEKIEKKISKDRDRNAFGDEVMKLFYNHFARYGLKHSTAGQKAIVTAASGCWEKGHPLLSEIADAQSRYGHWSSAEGQAVFGDRYFANSQQTRRYFGQNFFEQMEIDRIEKTWREAGKRALPGYFTSFGVPSAYTELDAHRKKALEEDKQKNRRVPTRLEMTAIELLRRTYQELAPNVMMIFVQSNTSYTVARTETILGALKTGRGYNSREVFLAESVFEADFADALAIFLHEHTHIFGYDGSRGFSDALTGLLAEIVRFRHYLGSYETDWQSIREQIIHERSKPAAQLYAGEENQAWLQSLDEQTLRQLVGSLPAPLINTLRAKELPAPRPIPVLRRRPMLAPASQPVAEPIYHNLPTRPPLNPVGFPRPQPRPLPLETQDQPD